MNSSDKHKVALAGGGIILAGLVLFPDPIADIRVTHDVAAPSVSSFEAKVDLGVIAFSYLRNWKRLPR